VEKETTMTTTTPPATTVRHADERPATWFLNGLATNVVTTDETGGAYNVTEHLVTAAGNPPMHVQTAEDEAFFVLDGEIELEVDGRVVTGTVGSFAFVPRGAAHTFRVLSPTARMLVICSGRPTDNLQEFFFAMGEPTRTRSLPEPAAPDVDRLLALSARAGIEYV
jgi:quercetin dioxygenase-like cupin family protein